MKTSLGSPLVPVLREIHSVREAFSPVSEELSEDMLDVEKIIRAVEARRHRIHVQIAGATPHDHVTDEGHVRVRDMYVDDIAAAMKWAPEWARKQVNISRTLVMRLPETLRQLEIGGISAYQASVIAEGAMEILTKKRVSHHDYDSGREIVGDFQELILPRASQQSVSELKRNIRRAVVSLAPMQADEAHEFAAQKRRVEMTIAQDGMCWVNLYCPTIEGQKIINHIKVAAAQPMFTGTSAQNQADAMVALICSEGSSASPATGSVPEVQVVVSLETLLRLSDEPGVIRGNGDSITANAVRDLAEGARLRRLVVEAETGQILDYGRTTYKAPQSLRDKIVARDQVCRYPGCNRGAEKLDLDHTEPWETGGATSEGNLVAVCRRHHNLKTHTGWQYEMLPDGSVEWTSPSGNKLVDHARPVLG